MEASDANALLTQIHTLLYRLGVSGNLRGFSYASCAIFLSMRHPERVNGELYPEIAQLCHVQPEEVRHGLRRLLYLIWKRQSNHLQCLMGRPCASPPSPKAFISAACRYLQGCP